MIVAKGGQGGNTLTMFDPGQTSLFGVSHGGVLGGVLLGILLFVGFEAAASIGEESHDPHRSIPRAVLVGPSPPPALLFTFIAYAFSIGYGHAAVSKGAWALDPAAVDTLGDEVHRVVVLDDPRPRRDPRRDRRWRWRSASRSGAATSRSAATGCCRRCSRAPRASTRRGSGT